MKRRAILSAVGSLTTVGMVGTVTAQNRTEERTRKSIKEAFKQEGPNGVKKELERHNLEYTETTSTLKPEEEELSTEASYDESDVTLMLAEGTSSDRVWATVYTELEGIDPFGDNYTGVEDAIGISFNEDHWSSVGGGSLAIDYPSDVDEDGDISWYSSSLEDGGLAAEVELPIDYTIQSADYPPDWTNLSLMTELENLDGVAGDIFGSYVHNGGDSGYIDSISGGAGMMSVTLSGWGATTIIDEATVEDPEPYIE